MSLNLERVKRNIRQANTQDLLDRVTAFRQGMEPEAAALIEEELRQRGVTAEDLLAHAAQLKRRAIFLADGTAARCSLCPQPAVAQVTGWHRVWGVVPVFPRTYYYCADHSPSDH